jgi:hypothetical protein
MEFGNFKGILKFIVSQDLTSQFQSYVSCSCNQSVNKSIIFLNFVESGQIPGIW